MSKRGAKHIVVMGAGESGVGAALLAKEKGCDVWVSDAGDIQDRYRVELEAANIPFETGKHTERKFFEADCIVKSPGIPNRIPLLIQAREQGVEIISELEWGYRHCSARLIAITGSNGKTTTTQLIYHLLKHAGISVSVAGNIGYSFARILTESQSEVYVLEVSSFQLEDIQHFRPDIGVFLNLTPDHLDRYEYDFWKYGRAKMNIVKKMKEEDGLVFFEEDPAIAKLLAEIKHPFRRLPFGMDRRAGTQAWLENTYLHWMPSGKMDFSSTRLLGVHNQLNCLAAIVAAKQWGIPDELVEEGLREFNPVAHRLEFLGSEQGITFINDSKATNIDAVKFALQAMEEPTIWIVGGVDKGNDYSILADSVKEKVKGIVVLGGGKEKIQKAFPEIPFTQVNSMNTAVKEAIRKADKGYTVLLSPACASFDLFKNYKDRGDQFKEAVREWKQMNPTEKNKKT